MSHILGRREFWSLDLAVTPDVLTPRPDSETLIEDALAAYDRLIGEGYLEAEARSDEQLAPAGPGPGHSAGAGTPMSRNRPERMLRREPLRLISMLASPS